MNSTKIKDMSKNIFNSLLHAMTPASYHTAIVDLETDAFNRPGCRDAFIHNIKSSKTDFELNCGRPKHFLHLPQEQFRTMLED